MVKFSVIDGKFLVEGEVDSPFNGDVQVDIEGRLAHQISIEQDIISFLRGDEKLAQLADALSKGIQPPEDCVLAYLGPEVAGLNFKNATL